MSVNEIAVRDGTIRLGQFLKLADAVDQGSDVKRLLASLQVTVNGEPEARRGRQLQVGDEVGVGSARYRVGRAAERPAGSTAFAHPPRGNVSTTS